MTEKDVAEVMEEETIETFEFTDEEGQDHCFVVESRFKVGKDDYVALLEVDPSIFAEEEDEASLVVIDGKLDMAKMMEQMSNEN